MIIPLAMKNTIYVISVKNKDVGRQKVFYDTADHQEEEYELLIFVNQNIICLLKPMFS